MVSCAASTARARNPVTAAHFSATRVGRPSHIRPPTESEGCYAELGEDARELKAGVLFDIIVLGGVNFIVDGCEDCDYV